MKDLKFRVFDLDRNCYATQIITFKFNRVGEINVVVYLDKIQRKGEILAEDKIYCNNFRIECFTGVKDKNGKDIYEGDIIHNVLYGGVAIVTWGNSDKDYAGWCIEWIYHIEKKKGWRDLLYYKNLENCKVIGNIHENTELLNK